MASAPSNLLVRHGAEYFRVPQSAVVRRHGRVLSVSALRLEEMLSGKSVDWPIPTSLDPAAIVVLKGRIRGAATRAAEGKPNAYVWYLTITVDDRETDDATILVRVPSKVCKDLLQFMARDQLLCASSLVLVFQPACHNRRPLSPDDSGADDGWWCVPYREGALEAVRHDAAALARVSVALLDDRELVLAAVRQARGARASLALASPRLQADPELAWWANAAPAQRARRKLYEHLITKSIVFHVMEHCAMRHELARIKRAKCGDVDDPLDGAWVR